MEVIDTYEDLQKLADFLENKNLRVDRFFIQGRLQPHHHMIINELKKQVDVVIVQFNEFFDYISKKLRNPQAEYVARLTYQDIEMSAYNENGSLNDNIDYLVVSKLPKKEKLNRIMNKISQDYYILLKECKRLNLSSLFAVEAMYTHVANDPLKKLIKDRIGPKNLLQLLLHRKCFSKIYKHYPKRTYESIINDCHWTFYKCLDGKTVQSRSGPTVFSHLRDRVYEALLNGETKFEKFKKIAKSPFLIDYHFTLLDLKTLEKINEINDNCVFAFTSFGGLNFIFIKEGQIIY